MDGVINNLIVGRAVEWLDMQMHNQAVRPGIYFRGTVLALELDKNTRFQLLIQLKQVQAKDGRWVAASHHVLMTVSALACHFPTLEPDTEVKTDDTFRKQG